MTASTALWRGSRTAGVGDPVPSGGWRGRACIPASAGTGTSPAVSTTSSPRTGHPVGPPPGTEPTSPPPTRRDELTWMATKGTKWVLRRCTDLLPYLLAMAVRDCFRGPRRAVERARRRADRL